MKDKIETAIKALNEVLNDLNTSKKSQKRTYKRGQRFMISDAECILASTDHKNMALICLGDGNRWHDPVPVDKSWEVTESEMKELTNGKPFELI